MELYSDIDFFAKHIKNNTPLMSFDMGEKKIGIAKSNPEQTIAVPYDIYYRQNMRKDIGSIYSIIKKNNIFGLVFGVTNQNKETDYTKNTKNFINKLHKKLIYEKNIMPILLYDENLTSFQAKNILKDFNYSAQQTKNQIDKIAASIILNEVLLVILKNKQ